MRCSPTASVPVWAFEGGVSNTSAVSMDLGSEQPFPPGSTQALVALVAVRWQEAVLRGPKRIGLYPPCRETLSSWFQVFPTCLESQGKH